MKLETIKQIWRELNAEIFTPAGYTLPETGHFKTRSNNCWANYADWRGYMWNRSFKGMSGTVRELVAHEMVHQWQDEYMKAFYKNMNDEYNSHDKHFFSWADVFAAHNMRLEEK
jgi:hypothetical protein